MNIRRIYRVSLGIILLFMSAMGCQDKKRLEAAKGNAIEYARARCECDKLNKQNPPGDTRQCTERMQRSLRYLNINFEMGKIPESARQEINKMGDESYERCMKSVEK